MTLRFTKQIGSLYLCFHYVNVNFTLTDYNLIDMNESLVEKYLLTLSVIYIKIL